MMFMWSLKIRLIMDRIVRLSCPVCDGKNVYKVCDKFGAEVKENFIVNRCKNCDCVYVENPIHPNHLGEIYNSKYFSGDGMDDTVDYVENLNRQEYFFEKYDYQMAGELKQYKIKKGSTWLDIGCALGNTLDWAVDRYHAVTFGVEYSDIGRQYSTKKGHEIIGVTTEEVPSKFDGFFDVVTCYEVLEHLYEPNKVILDISRLLKDGGVFHYSTGAPPRDSEMLNWDYLRPEVHIVFYSPKCMEYLFVKNGLTPNLRKNLSIKRRFDYYKLNYKQKVKLLLPRWVINLFRPYQPDALKNR